MKKLDPSTNQPAGPEIQITANEEMMTGKYANTTRITHSFDDVVLDFIYMHNNPPFGRMVSRIVLTPAHAKRLLKALGENIQKYEEMFGAVQELPSNSAPLKEVH